MAASAVLPHVREFLDAFRSVKMLGLRWIIIYNEDNSREIYYQSRLGFIMHAKFSEFDPFPVTEKTKLKTFTEAKQYVRSHHNKAKIIKDSDDSKYIIV